jgi:hypothetical protein
VTSSCRLKCRAGRLCVALQERTAALEYRAVFPATVRKEFSEFALPNLRAESNSDTKLSIEYYASNRCSALHSPKVMRSAAAVSRSKKVQLYMILAMRMVIFRPNTSPK